MDGEVLYENNEGTELVDSLNESGSFEVWMQMALKLREETFARAILAASLYLHYWNCYRCELSFFTCGILQKWKDRNPKIRSFNMGDPLKLMGNFNSTAVGLERRAGTLKHLPLGLDELQVLNEKRLSPSLIAYSLGNGYGKTRGAKNGGLQDVPTWRNSIISTGEQPLASENSMDGVNSRVLELYGQPVSNPEYGREVHRISESNYGFAGRMFIQYLIDEVIMNKKKMHEDFETMRDTLVQKFSNLNKGDIGVHLDTIAVLSLADWYSSVSVFNADKDIAWKEAVELGIALLSNAKSRRRKM